MSVACASAATITSFFLVFAYGSSASIITDYVPAFTSLISNVPFCTSAFRVSVGETAQALTALSAGVTLPLIVFVCNALKEKSAPDEIPKATRANLM